MTKLARMLKLVKHRRKLIRNMGSRAGVERLLWFTITFLVATHLIACFYIMVAQFNEKLPDNWILKKGLIDEGVFGVYMASFYW